MEGNDIDLETDTNFSPDFNDEGMNNEDTISPIIINNGPNFTPDNNDEENNNVDNISPIQMNDGDDHENNTNADNEILETRKSILLLGMSTVDVQETVKTKGSTNSLDEISTTTAQQCVTRNIISTTDNR